MRLRAILRAQERTGLVCRQPDRIVIGFRDSPVDTGFGASSRLVQSRDGQVHLITLSTEQLMLGVMDVDASLVHESIHCIMRERMGDRQYRALPKWIREGIAVWGAGQLPERARNVVATAFLERRDPETILERVGQLDGPPDYYMMVALAFEYISHNHGEQAVRSLIADVVEGVRPSDAFEKATGLPLAEVESSRREFARMYFEGLLHSSGLFEFRQAQRLYRSGDTATAIEKLVTLARDRPDSLLQANAWYWAGRWSFELERYPQAALAFSIVVDHFPEHVGVYRGSRHELDRCYRRMSEKDVHLVRTVYASPLR
jgi:hypothetical protein